MRAPQERTMRDLYDRTQHEGLALAPAEEPAQGRAEGPWHREPVSKMEHKTTIRKRLVPSNNNRVKTESGTCNVCCAPCSSCLHRGLAPMDSKVGCASSQTCSTRSEVKNNSIVRGEKGLLNKGVENDDEFSATSDHVSYSEAGGNKAVARSSVADDSSEVDMPAKRRRLLKQDTILSDSNSCVTGTSADGKLLVDRRKLSTSASSRDLTAKDYKDINVACHSRLRTQCVDKSTEKKGSDVRDMHPSSSGRSFPADSPSVMTKKLLRAWSSVSASNRLSPKMQASEFGKPHDNLSCQSREKASHSNNNTELLQGENLNPCLVGGDNHGMLVGCSKTNENKADFSPKDMENVMSGNDMSCLKDKMHADIQSNDDTKRNVGDKQDGDQDCSMDISGDGTLNIHHDVVTDCGNSEGLIDVNVCDICGDVGREYLLATCTRCLEGAEHTYCMRVKLDKVPDGEWLCEECQLKEDQIKTRNNCGVTTVNISEGKNQESRGKPKALQIVVPDLDAPQIICSTPTADPCHDKIKNLASADTQKRQAKATTPAAERLDEKNKKMLSMPNRKKLQVLTSDLEAQPHTYGTPTSGNSKKKSQSSEFCLNRKKLRVSTEMESPLSCEGLRSLPIPCKRQAELSPKPRPFKTDGLRKCDVFSHDNSFKKSNKGGLNSLDNTTPRTTQAVKSSQTLSRSYSLGSMVNPKAAVPSPRGLLSKQLSFNNANNGPKVKQLAEGVASKLRPAKHSPRDPRDRGPIKKLIKSSSLKYEGSVCIDAGSSKQKQSFHLYQDEKPGVLKPMKEKKKMETSASFSFKKPNITSSPRPDSFMKSRERKLDQDVPRSGPGILKSSKKTGNIEKKQSLDLSKSVKQDISVHPKPMEVVSGKDAYIVKISDPTVPPQCVQNDSSNNVGDDDMFVPVKFFNNTLAEHPDALPTCTAVTCESDLRDESRASTSDDSAPKGVSCQQKLVESPGDDSRVCTSNDSAPKGVSCQQKLLESPGHDSCKIEEAAQASGDTLAESLHGLQMVDYLSPPGNKLDKPDLKEENFVIQFSNPSRDLVIPEQSYIWQGGFEVSTIGNSPEVFDGIQAYLSTCASSKVRELSKQLPYKIQLAEVPRHSSWPLQFTEVNPTEDSIALFFFAKDVKSYERAYSKLLDNILLGDLSLTANIGGTQLLIFPSDKLPQRIQRWNGLLFFWGIFYARKASSPFELPVTVVNNCPVEQISGSVKHEVCSPKVLQSLGIDLNECPNDDLSDPVISLGLESKESAASVDHNILLESKFEDRKLNASELYHEETAGTRQIVLGHPTAAPYGTDHPTIQDYPTTAKGIKGTTGRDKMEEKDNFYQNQPFFCVAHQAGAIRSISNEIIPQKHGLLPSLSQQHFSEPKISDDPNKVIPRSDMGSLDSDLTHKRQKTSYAKYSTCGFGPNKCLSKIHPLPAGQHNLFRSPSDPGSFKNPIPDDIIHVLSSDDEDSAEPRTSLNKAFPKEDKGSSPLLSLSLSTVAGNHDLSGSDIGEDEPLSLSLGLPSVEGTRGLEMKQFLPEKPGINT